MWQTGLHIVRTEGVLALYNGLKPTIIRTIPATAVLFVVYEYSKKAMNSLFSWTAISACYLFVYTTHRSDDMNGNGGGGTSHSTDNYYYSLFLINNNELEAIRKCPERDCNTHTQFQSLAIFIFFFSRFVHWYKVNTKINSIEPSLRQLNFIYCFLSAENIQRVESEKKWLVGIMCSRLTDFGVLRIIIGSCANRPTIVSNRCIEIACIEYIAASLGRKTHTWIDLYDFSLGTVHRVNSRSIHFRAKKNTCKTQYMHAAEQHIGK